MVWSQFCSFLIDVLWWSPFDGLAYNPLIRASYNLAVQRGSSQYLQFGLVSYTQMNHMSVISNLNVLASVEGLAGTRVVPMCWSLRDGEFESMWQQVVSG